MNTQFWEWFDGYAVPKLALAQPKLNRINTFRLMLQHLDKFERPVIVETGCVNTDDAKGWCGNGCSTLIFDKYAQLNGGRVFSVESDLATVKGAHKLVSAATSLTCFDSVNYLSVYARDVTSPFINLLYLDASHNDWHLDTECQVHHYNELQAAMPRLNPDSLVAVDDSPMVMDIDGGIEPRGKGGLIGRYAASLGVELVFSEYQSGWVGWPGTPQADDEAADALLFRARAHLERNDWYGAQELYRAVLMRLPPPWNGRQRVMHGEACAFFARLAVKYERFGTALDWYRKALHADPLATEYRIEFVADVLLKLGMTTTAKIEAGKATQMSPDDPVAWRMLGISEGRDNNVEASLAAHQKQAEVSNRGTVALCDIGCTLIDMERYKEAERIFAEIVDRGETKRIGDVHHCQAMILARKGKHEEAIELYEKSLAEGCGDQSLVHFHLSLSLHSIGRYKEGWEHLAYRKDNKSDPSLWAPMRRFDRPIFAMQEPPATVHVHAEGGAGDNFCMARYLPMLVERGYTVRYETFDNMFYLMRDNLPGVEVFKIAVNFPGDLGIKPFDYHCPVGELPRVFGTDIDTVPENGPYIKANPGLASLYRETPKIGLAWSSGIRDSGVWLKRYGGLKSPGWPQVSDLFNWIMHPRPKDLFVSLQVGPERADNQSIADVLPEKPTWSDTAALIENLDLVITPDTGLAHLAGAMGKETWLMMHGHNQGWHFMCERPGALWNLKSPWYPSIRIFRQKTPGDWRSVIKAVAHALKQRMQTDVGSRAIRRPGRGRNTG